MKKGAASLLALLTKSKIELACFLLFIAWIVIVFVFYLPQTSKATVAGVSTHKNFHPKPTVTPTPTVHSSLQGITQTPTQQPTPTKTSGSPSANASSPSSPSITDSPSQTAQIVTPVPATGEQVTPTAAEGISPTPTINPNGNQAIISNGVDVTPTQAPLIQVTPTPAGFSAGGVSITVGTTGNGSESTNTVTPNQ